MQQMKLLIGTLALLAGTAAALPAQAGDDNGNFMVRVLGTVVDPDSSAKVSTAAGVIPGSDADVGTEVIPALTLSYFLDKNWAVELFCCFADMHADAKGTIAPLGRVADFWVFPPALTLQYHFDHLGAFKPYVGAGLQYIHFFDETGNQFGAVKIDDAVGFTLQAGIDLAIGQGWYLNADVKKTWISTDVHWINAGLQADVDIDPWILSAGLGYRFNLEDVFGRPTAPVALK